MKAGVIVHQQICQLRWHLLACLGLLMVLPIEEAIVNLDAGDGFYSDRMMFAALSFSPLLAGLIACANIQADLNEKRYIFWRSKPANAKLLLVLKFFTGLIAFFIIVACPIVFATVTCALANESFYDTPFPKYYFAFFSLIGIMVFSLCFGCNVLVRNTARSWLIGMFLAGLVLVIPFMLPLGFTDIVSDVEMWAFGFYPAFILVMSVAAFVFALYAVHYDWHLRTNLKGLLCVAAGLVFVLLMLFSSQVANIRVLDEEVIGGFGALDNIGDRTVLQARYYVQVSNEGMTLESIGSNTTDVINPPTYGNVGIDSEGHRTVYGQREKGYFVKTYPRSPNALYMDTKDDLYCFGIVSYYRQEEQERWKHRKEKIYEKVCLRSYKLVGNSWQAIDELDISECLTGWRTYLRIAMRPIDKTMVACINRSFVTVDVTRPDELKVIDKELDVIRDGLMRMGDEERNKELSIPLVPVEGIGNEARIRLSIDLAYRFDHRNDIYDSSIVDIRDDKIAFFSVSERDVARFDVTRRDDDNIYCSFSAARPFTTLETMVRPQAWIGPDDSVFVQDQRLYFKQDQQLMVFDVRPDHRIRKLGHFYRMDYSIEDIEVLDDGKLLLSASWDRHLGKSLSHSKNNSYLYLLENPE